MAFDTFIKLSSIEGESEDDRHKRWIEVLNYGLSHKQRIHKYPDSCGGTCGWRAEFYSLVFKKEIDASIPLLNLACAEGQHIDEVVLDTCRPGNNKMGFMQYRFKNCMIHMVSTLGTKNFTRELVRIDFGKIIWDYTQQNRDTGHPVGHFLAGWDRQTNSVV